MYRHHTTFNNPALRSETALADYIWDLQCPDRCYERGVEECEHSIDYEITWKILARAPGYNPITGICRLCLKESFLILFHPETASLNKKTEIYQSCKHRNFKFLADCKVTWSPWRPTQPNYNHIFIFTFPLLIRQTLMFHNQSWCCVSNCWRVDDETNLYNYSRIHIMRHLLLSLWYLKSNSSSESCLLPADFTKTTSPCSHISSSINNLFGDKFIFHHIYNTTNIHIITIISPS